MSFQQNYTPYEDVTSPTIAIEELFALLIIDAHEGKALHIFDVPGAYLHVSLYDDSIAQMKCEGEVLDIMCEVNPG